MNARYLALLLAACLQFSWPYAAAEEAASTGAPRVEYEKLALRDLLRRAHGGNSHAQFELGSRFNYGRSAPKNVEEALNWLRRAGLAGQRDAQRLLAVKYFNGYDVAVDQEEAFRWTQRLAEGGDPAGQVTLASLYANGEGVARSLVRSYMWYAIGAVSAQQAAEAEEVSPLAQEAATQRDKIAALLMPDEEREAQRLASEWWLKKQGVSLQPPPPSKAKAKAKTKPKPASAP